MTWEVKQRIDFYFDDFKPPRLPADLRFIVIGLGIHAGFAVLLIAGLLINGYFQQGYLDEMVKRQNAVEMQVSNIENERPSLQLDSDLVAERDKAGNNLESSRRILQYLTQQDIGESHSFRGLVEGLTNQEVSGVWLSGFRFSDEGRNIRLTGHTTDPVKVSGYAGSLLDQESYQGRSFRLIQVSKEEDQPYLTFVLDTRNKDDKETPASKPSLTSKAIKQKI